MACRRFAGRCSGAGVTSTKGIAIAIVTIAAAAGLAGCITAPIPGSPEEQIWFDKAQGYEIHHVPAVLRLHGAIGYPRTDFRVYQRPPPPGFDEP